MRHNDFNLALSIFTGLEDPRAGLEAQQMTGLYGHRSNSSASSSPPAASAASNAGNGTASGGGSNNNGGLVVPQPINAAKMGSGGGMAHGGGASGRKYQCKMCPQVRKCCFKSLSSCYANTLISVITS